MSDVISQLWQKLRDAGMPEVMLYLDDGTASRCHWDETALVGGERVALLADQERGIVRVLPVRSCVGIGIASPKGVDPSGYRHSIRERLNAAAVASQSEASNPSESALTEADPVSLPTAHVGGGGNGHAPVSAG